LITLPPYDYPKKRKFKNFRIKHVVTTIYLSIQCKNTSTEIEFFNETPNNIFKHLLFIFQIRQVSRDERGLTSSLGRPYGTSSEVVAVSTLIRRGACGGAQHHQQQQQQQQQQPCPPRGEQGFDCEKDTAITLAVLLAIETLLGAILIAFPKSRACIVAALDLVKAIRIQKSPQAVGVVEVVVEAAPSASAPQDQEATVAAPPTNQVVPMPRLAARPPKRPAPLAPRPTPPPIENWCKTKTYIRDPSFKNLAIISHLIKKILIVESLSVTKIIISHAICIDLYSQL
jgi:hypothetical protein